MDEMDVLYLNILLTYSSHRAYYMFLNYEYVYKDMAIYRPTANEISNAINKRIHIQQRMKGTKLSRSRAQPGYSLKPIGVGLTPGRDRMKGIL